MLFPTSTDLVCNESAELGYYLKVGSNIKVDDTVHINIIWEREFIPHMRGLWVDRGRSQPVWTGVSKAEVVCWDFSGEELRLGKSSQVWEVWMPCVYQKGGAFACALPSACPERRPKEKRRGAHAYVSGQILIMESTPMIGLYQLSESLAPH